MDLKIFQINIVANSGINTPQMVDYRHIGLFKKEIQSKGITTKIEFYKEFTAPNIYSDLIVEEVYTYLESSPYYVGQVTNVNWLNLDDTIGFNTSFTYMFLPSEIIDFGIHKKNNILSVAKMFAFGQLGANAYSLLDYCQAEISVYVQGNTPPLLAKVDQSVGVITGMTQAIADQINAILIDT